ncbi:hypothetical protein KR018_011367 [Drosophila ironensis]|nr:hypothetical protein KR018_011367 [Drosophila ironensis]
MIPECEHSILMEEEVLEESCYYEDCGQSRCEQTAWEVYQRILQRLQAQTQESATDDSDLMKQLWLASFTGRPIQYQS